MSHSYDSHLSHPTSNTERISSTNKRLPHLNEIQINQNILIALISLYLVMTANFSFFYKVMTVYPLAQNYGFIVSLYGLLFGLIWLVIQLLSYRMTVKAVLIFMIMISAICGYFTDAYGTIFDTNMLINSLQTDKAEASDLFAFRFLLRVLLLGVMPSLLVAKVTLTPASWKRGFAQKIMTLLAALGLISSCLFLFGNQYASFFRQHKPLRYYTLPITPIYSSIRLSTDYIDSLRRPDSLIPHATDAKHINATAPDSKPKLMVFVVGETARTDHIGLNGYQRDTTPLLSKLNDIYSYKDVTACGTSTAYSVPCMFSYADQKDYKMERAKYNENVLDTLQKQGIKVIWRDNNSSSKGVADRVNYETFKTHEHNPICDLECRDIGMLDGFDALIDNTKTQANTPHISDRKASKPQDILIVLHQMGNHGPAYYKRYPKEFEVFTPVCASNELSKCNSQSIINGYDNAIRYTDYFLSAVIKKLKAYEADYDVVMLYVSDHGESLGENHIYLHGLPYSIAPKTQKQVPAIVWSPASNHVDKASIERLTDQPVSHDYITPTLLSFFDITTQETTSKPTFFDLL